MDFKTSIKKKDALKIIKILAIQGHEVRFAGGCVRDLQLNLRPSDFDLASTSRPEENLDILTKHGFKCIPTGLDHGTITVIQKSGPVEITTLRKDVDTDGRHADVLYSKSWEEDSARRDFTINAMYEDIDGKIYDFHDGISDIKTKQLKFVGKTEKRIQEDYLRILRFFRFKAQLGFYNDAETLKAIKSNREGLLQISQERITSEMRKMLSFNTIRPSMEDIYSTKVAEIVFSEYSNKNLDQLDELQNCSHRIRFHSRLYSLCILRNANKNKNKIQKLCQNWKLSGLDKKIIELIHVGSNLGRFKSSITEQMDLLDMIDELKIPDVDAIPSLLEVWKILFSEHQNSIHQLSLLEDQKGHIRRKPLPITGKDLIEIGIPQGQQLGEILSQLKSSFRKEMWKTKEEGVKLAKDL